MKTSETKELTLDDLRKITWDYSQEGVVGLYHDEIIRQYLWEVRECGDVDPLLVTRCNVVEGWIEHLESDGSPRQKHKLLANLLRDENGNIIKTKVDCKVIVDLLDTKGNVIVTLKYKLMDKDILEEILLEIAGEMIQIAPYAGNALFSGDEAEIKFWKGQYLALERIRKFVEEKHLVRLVKEDEEEEKKTFAEHVEERMATLLPHDHRLFAYIVDGLVGEGWLEQGGSQTYRLLYKGDSTIKIFRDEKAPTVIKICFSAEPEEVDEETTQNT